jgi:hypothetical protein
MSDREKTERKVERQKYRKRKRERKSKKEEHKSGQSKRRKSTYMYRFLLMMNRTMKKEQWSRN